MNYRKLRIIIFALFFPVVFFLVGFLKYVIRYLFLLFLVLFFVVPVYADTPAGGWASSVSYYWQGATLQIYTYTPAPAGAMACKMVKQVEGATGEFVGYVSSVVTGTCSGNFTCTYPYPYAVVCSDALKAAYVNSESPPDSACLAGKDWVGGCNGTLKYCEGTATYNSANIFLNELQGVSDWNFFTAVDADGKNYKCISSYFKNGKMYVAILNPYNFELNPATHSLCIGTVAYNALNNTSCTSSGTNTIGGNNTNIYVNKQTSKPCQKDVNGVYTDCGSSVTYDTLHGQVTQVTGTGETTLTPSGGGSSVPVISEGSGSGGSGIGDKIAGTDGNCYDGIKNGSEITADKGGRCIGITTGTGAGTGTGLSIPIPNIPDITQTGSATIGGGQYTGGDGSGKPAFNSSAVSDNSELKTLVSGFFNSMKASTFFSMPSSLFQSFPSGGSPDITFDAGRYGIHTYNFSTAWASIIPLLKGIVIAVFAVVSVKVIILKGGSG